MKVARGGPQPVIIDGYAMAPAQALEMPRSPPADGPSFRQVLSGLAREVDRGQAVVSRALRADPGGDDSRSMIALQAGVYRYVEAIDLCTRLVDRAAGAVRTTLQSQ